MSFYPSTLASFTTKVDNVSTVAAADVNNLQNEVVALETYIGTNPQGSQATLVARLGQSVSSTGTLLANTVGSSQIIINSVGANQVASGAIHSYHLAAGTLSSIPSIKLHTLSAHTLNIPSGAVATGTPLGLAYLMPISPINGTSTLSFTLNRITTWFSTAPSGTLTLAVYKNGVYLQSLSVTSQSNIFTGLAQSFVTNDIFQIGVVGSNSVGYAGLAFTGEFSTTY